MSDKPTFTPFSINADFDYDVRGVIGASVAGAGDPGEILAATEHVRKNDHEGWFAAWQALAERTAATADRSAQGSHRVSAAADVTSIQIPYGHETLPGFLFRANVREDAAIVC